MAVFFQSFPGQVVAVPEDFASVGLPLTIDGVQGSWFPFFKSILTGIALPLEGNYQFLHSLKDVIYAYSFGDRIGQLILSGLSFVDDCAGGQATGLEMILGLYEQNKMSSRADPLQVQIGVTAAGRFRGYMTSIKPEMYRPESRVSQFSLGFHVFPGGRF